MRNLTAAKENALLDIAEELAQAPSPRYERAKKETLLIAVLDAKEPHSALREYHWTPWVESDPANREQTVAIAAHRAARLRGIPPGESWEMNVYSAPASEPRNADGNPKTVSFTRFNITRE